MLSKMVVLLGTVLFTAGAAAGYEGKNDAAGAVPGVEVQADASGQAIPEEVTADHWAYKEVASLAEKFECDKKLPEGQPCTKKHLIDCFAATLVNVAHKYEKEGVQGITRDDLDSIRALIVALDTSLFRIDSYREIRRTIEQLLVQVEPPGVPYFKYKVGAKGFVRAEAQTNFRIPDATYKSGHSEGRLLYRVQPYAYWHPNNYLDIHLEGQGYGFRGGDQEHNRLGFYQGYVEAKLPREDVAGKNWVAVKAGRQEFNYGSGFFLGSDSFFNGLTFDAARVRVQPQVPWFNYLTIDLIGGRYATAFSDGVKGNLYGAYVTYEPAEDNTLEFYGFRDLGAEERHSKDHLDTIGFRSTSSVGMFGLEYELAYQTGKLFNGGIGESEKISAFGGHVDLTGEFKLGNYDSSVFFSYAMGSGDRDAVNGNSSRREFRNSNNDSSLVGDMGVIGDLSGVDVGDQHASGIQVFTAGWGIDIPVGTASQRMINFSATGRKFMAGKVADGLSRDLGVESDFTLTYTHNKDTSVVVGYDRFFTGDFFRQATGSSRDIDYVYAMLVFNYDWTKRIPLKR